MNVGRYARDEDRKEYRSGHCNRSFTTTPGNVNLRVPKLKGFTFETITIERCKRGKNSAEKAPIEIYLVSVTVRWVEDITELL